MSQSWPLKRVGLRVRDLSASLIYYQRLGLAIVRDQRTEGSVGLGVGKQEFLTLHHVPNAQPRSPHSAGLYHFAILLPDEKALGTFLHYALDNQVRVDGASDHLVSQALYLNDPEGNGIEIYADRPREQWPLDAHDRVTMDTQPLKAEALIKKAGPFHGLPEESMLGHMHLNVSNLDESTAFYEQTFGLDLMLKFSDQADFLSWNGYHHHLGLNIWTGPNASKHEAAASGIDFFEVARAGLQTGTFQDPNGVTVVVSEDH
jgi:catechol 2,3-dioxygenase